jgi:hypothetical protein
MRAEGDRVRDATPSPEKEANHPMPALDVVRGFHSNPYAVPPSLAPGAPTDVATAPRANRRFDDALATEQFRAAAAKAGTCGHAGPTRGSGRVKVRIEPSGRVGSVTHLNPHFIGTRVGLCVMEAFGRVNVPRFDGNSRSIAGDFEIR